MTVISKAINTRRPIYAGVLGLALSFSAVADNHDSESFDIETITCWDLTGLEDADRAPALTLVYGYVAGKHSMGKQRTGTISSALEKAGKLCEANPDMYVVSAVERTLKPVHKK